MENGRPQRTTPTPSKKTHTHTPFLCMISLKWLFTRWKTVGGDSSGGGSTGGGAGGSSSNENDTTNSECDRESTPLITTEKNHHYHHTHLKTDDDDAWQRFIQHFKLFTSLISYLWPKRRWDIRFRVIVSLMCLVLSRVVNVCTPFAYKHAVDTMAQERSVLPLWSILFYGLGVVLYNFLNNVRDVVFVEVQNNALRDVSIQLFTHLHNLSISFHLNRKTGGVLRAIDRGTKSIQVVIQFLIFSALPVLFEVLLVCTILIIRYTMWISIVTLIFVTIYTTFTLTMTEWRTKFRREMNRFENEANDRAVESLLNFETVKYFGTEQFETERYRDAINRYAQQAQKSTSSLAVLNVGQSAIISMGQLSVMFLCALQVSHGKMTVGDFVLVNTFILQLYAPLNDLGTSYRMIKKSLVDMENMFDLLRQKPAIRDLPGAKPFVPNGGEVVFENVQFKYNNDSNQMVLKGLSFKVDPGKQLAIVGPSGSGKSTINKLLFRFYDPTSGRILVDGQDISKVRQDSLRQCIGIVPQDTVLFNDTIRFNIQYGSMTASEQSVVKAAEVAAILPKIESFDHGWETIVGERGTRLSGGEKQRVAIARVVLKGSQIVVMDEATSALDSNTEKRIQEKLREVFKGKTTTIVFAHRLSTIVDSDEIIVLKDGLIVERGTHEQLLEMNGEYKKLWDKQSTKNIAAVT
jgi:ABC-type transport system involved in Fe-S cluster assembly fused permease/ATPase subunit